ncbi:1-aminocyclopropane-1-carboxylate deaminase/D-cysteine desulfhydrase [Vibrio genomosp. F10]|uniref:1-aminocyclopropane-1-carboxylate deaminase n=2 Tax=Vibrio genomosp. F10 TaxID=723171 RepID=A0A1B9R0Y5_9VIBR|nr:1-aminocyclopropane-1-carboxylate deaminase/D-cysteine desulfhydrase [Vibrio genomosp. F10]OCH77916.1 1-aminocyclopropane-1-carboxylate deaminase [Vibrio genomosp. F10]OEE36588.1 1-aminocyclopropane-1-carboxylate deaminase [Vibrio genomosp. F10 str. ZF-129]
MILNNSPVTQHRFQDIEFFLKRDDKLHSQFSGNKARKFRWLLNNNDETITTIIGYGSAQANSLYSLAALASIKGWQLEFYVDHIPHWLKKTPIGNYRGALDLGAKVIVVKEAISTPLHPADFIAQVRQPDECCIVVPEGGRSTSAALGVTELAEELLQWARYDSSQRCVVALPSGTGTTSLYLSQYLKPHGIEVLTCPCVGGRDYLIQQFHQLEPHNHPEILTLDSKHHFGQLDHEDYLIWQQLLEDTYVEFDLLYDPMMWRCLLKHRQYLEDKTLIYVHQGGILGNESMLPRYQRQWD